MNSFRERLRHNRNALFGIPDSTDENKVIAINAIAQEAKQIEALLVEKQLSLKEIQDEIAELEDRLQSLNQERIQHDSQRNPPRPNCQI